MKTVLLDMFGVVCPDGHFHRNVLKPLCKGALDVQVERDYNDLKFRRVDENEFWEKHGWEPVKGRAEMLNRIQLDPKLREVIAYLARKGYPLVLFSDFPKDWLDLIVDKKNLRVMFDQVVATPQWGYLKNNPRVYEEAKKQFGDCVVVDDKLNVLALAGKAGMETVWKKTVEEETSFEPDHVIRYLDELKGIL
ncbi:HAD family hydrolase [archaeon]